MFMPSLCLLAEGEWGGVVKNLKIAVFFISKVALDSPKIISICFKLVCPAQNIKKKIQFNSSFAEFYIKFLYPWKLLLAIPVVGQSSLSLRSHRTLKLWPYVTFGSEMK
jgi:hypothetical protein